MRHVETLVTTAADQGAGTMNMPSLDLSLPSNLDTALRLPQRPTRVVTPIHPVAWSSTEWMLGFFDMFCAADDAVPAIAAALTHTAGRSVAWRGYGSGSSALLAGLMAGGLPIGSEVAVSSFVCPSVILAVEAAGLCPRLLDCTPQGGGPSLRAFESCRSGDLSAIVLTHMYGEVMPEFDGLILEARRRALWVIDDAAQAWGARDRGLVAGLEGDIGVLSFGRTKPVRLWTGGALVATGSAVLDRAPAVACTVGGLRSWRAAALHATRQQLHRRQPAAIATRRHAWVTARMAASMREATHARIDPRLAPVLTSFPKRRLRSLERMLGQLERGQREASTKAAYLTHALAGAVGIQLPRVAPPATTFDHYAVRLQDRAGLADHLAAHGIETAWCYYPLHRTSRFAVDPAAFPNAEALWPSVLLLPCRFASFPELDRIATAIRRFLAGHM
jgi:perosamine synthetase